jgi:hypothetical protein
MGSFSTGLIILSLFLFAQAFEENMTQIVEGTIILPGQQNSFCPG